MEDNLKGIEHHQEIDRSKHIKDVRKPLKKIKDSLEDPNTFLIYSGILMGMMFLMSSFFEVFFVLELVLLNFVHKKKIALPCKLPQNSGMNDHNDPHPGHGGPLPASGIGFFGNERKTNKEIWFSNSDMRTHILIFGSTGAGKTETLLSLAYNALVQGSGLIYVDGKGENALYTKVFSMARAMGREDDMLVINYMTGSRDVFGPQEKKLSNTLNPFSSGSAPGLVELLVSLMDDSGGGGGGDMWKGRAISLLAAVMPALVWMRDRKEILLDVEVIRQHLVLDTLTKLYRTRRDLPQYIRSAIQAYLVSLPGFQENAPKQGETTLEQHGYLQMQFTRILSSLGDNYGYIFKTNLGEVDFWDVVVNRRILVVLLPALEKSQEELANLGKIIVACLKQMMGSGLGSTIEGDFADIVETKPTTSPVPFMCILDEYGYYAVKGSAVMPAQARSLGFCMIFAGQDYAAFKKASPEEAESIAANCNVKIFMKLEDAKETYDLFDKLVGDTEVIQSGQYEYKDGKYSQNQGGQLVTKKRGTLQDLKDQGMGQGHILYKSSIIRARMFFADPKPAKTIGVNYFLRVEEPEEKDMLLLDNGLKNLIKKISMPEMINEIRDFIDTEDDIQTIQSIFNHGKAQQMNPMEVACAAFGLLSEQKTIKMGETASAFEGLTKEDEDKQIDIFFEDDDEDEDEDEDNFNSDFDEDENINVFLDEEKTRRRFEEIERSGGSSEDESRRNAEQIMDDMRKVSEYPLNGEPEAKEAEEIVDILKELEESFELDEDEDD